MGIGNERETPKQSVDVSLALIKPKKTPCILSPSRAENSMAAYLCVKCEHTALICTKFTFLEPQMY